MQIDLYIAIIVLLGIMFFMTGIVVLYWCVKNGQLKDFEKGAKSIFTEEEPEGVQTDFFPGKRNIINDKIN